MKWAYWGKTPRERVSILNVLSSHPATELQVCSRPSWTAHTPPSNGSQIYTSLDQPTLQLWNNAGSLVQDIALLERGMKGALQSSTCSSDDLVQPHWASSPQEFPEPSRNISLKRWTFPMQCKRWSDCIKKKGLLWWNLSPPLSLIQIFGTGYPWK